MSRLPGYRLYLAAMQEMPFVLYKNPVQADTLDIVRFLHSASIFDASPSCCIERNWPPWVTELPAIKDLADGTEFVGLQRCVSFWEHMSGVPNLFERAKMFAEEHPKYRVHG
jgi:hypothetical protein